MADALPLFVYGTLKPGQLAFRQVAALVEPKPEPAEVLGHKSHIRDGLPAVIPTNDPSNVVGYLLRPLPGLTAEFNNVVSWYEPRKLYTSPQVVEVETSVGRHAARTHQMRSPEKGNSQPSYHNEWGLEFDPLFSVALPVLTEQIRQAKTDVFPDSDSAAFWRDYIPMQGYLLALCGVLERYLTLAYGLPDSINARLDKLVESDEGQHAIHFAAVPPLAISRADTLDHVSAETLDHVSAETLGHVSGEKYLWKVWYQIRSNLVHRGKDANRDFDVVANAVYGLHDALRYLLAAQLPALVERWELIDHGVDWALNSSRHSDANEHNEYEEDDEDERV